MLRAVAEPASAMFIACCCAALLVEAPCFFPNLVIALGEIFGENAFKVGSLAAIYD